MTVFIWDASDYDWARGPMDLAAARRAGIDGFTHKATEGIGTKHRHYGEAMRRARDAGVPVLGAYHVVRSGPSPRAQVDFLLSYMDQATPWWRDWPHFFIQVDLEKWPYDSVSAAVGEAFADVAEQLSGRRAIIYASRGQYGNELAGTSHELWNANYGANITAPFRDVYTARGGDNGPGWVSYSGRMPVIWQYGSRTTIGVQNICDANAFRGTVEQLCALINPSNAGPQGKGTEMLIKTKDDPTVYISDGYRYRPLGPDVPAGSALAALQAAERAGHKLMTVASLPELEAIAGKPATTPEPLPITLSEADRQDIADRVAAKVAGVDEQEIAATVLRTLTPEAIAEALDGEVAQELLERLTEKLAAS